MMKKLLFISVFLFGGMLDGATQNVLIKMPNYLILSEQLEERGLGNFNEKTGIAKHFGDCLTESWKVHVAVECALTMYQESVNNVRKATKMWYSRNAIYEALLNHSPEALKRLEIMQLYIPTDYKQPNKE